jgi:hypothetical protein
MDARVAGLATILALDTRLFRNCLDGVDDERARRRVGDATNSIAFVAGHLVESRHALAGGLGVPGDSAVADLLRDARGIADLPELPTVAELLLEWDAVSGRLKHAVEAMDAAALDAPSPQRFPVADESWLGALAFLAQHEAYHIGQLALLRKHAGLPAMRYR